MRKAQRGGAGRGVSLVEEHEVLFAATAVKLPAIKVVLDEGVDVALDLRVALVVVLAMVTADAVVAVPGGAGSNKAMSAVPFAGERNGAGTGAKATFWLRRGHHEAGRTNRT